jgi:Protein of unknown function (DUF1549)/Protein of unknown function (DUF1553)/Planctomycete cytochrome C
MTASMKAFLVLSLAGVAVLVHAWPVAAQPSATAATPGVSFAHQIHPILELRCYECHDAPDPENHLNLTTVGGMLAGGEKAGPAVVPGKPDRSPILEYLTGARHPQMPKKRKPLSDDQIALIRTWIAEGARDDSLAGGLPATVDARESAQVPRLAVSHVPDPGLEAQVNDATFGDAETMFVLRRQLRLARMPVAASPPATYPGSDNPIDQFIAASWKDAHLPESDRPPSLIDDRGYIRRVSLDVIGVVPTPDEVERFAADPSPDKRGALVDRLLARHEDYAANWTPFWEDALGSQTTKLLGGIPTRGNYHDWIYAQFVANMPFDIFAASLIDPAMPRHKPSVDVDANGKKSRAGYILNNTPTDAIQSAANVAQVFLGTSMKCASCHNHFLNDEWPQTRFLAFAGLFTDHDLELIRCERKTGQIVPARFPFALPEVPSSVPDTLQGRLHRAALLLTDPTNPRFARSIVNRLWRRYLGLGLVEPADDFRLERAPSQPALLDWLADDFMRQGFDLPHTIRLILTSHTYQHVYDPSREDRFDVQKPDLPRYYRSPRLRRLTAEEFIDSVRQVSSGHLDRRERVFNQQESTALTRALGRPAARNEISTSRSEDAAVLQALEIMNGPELSSLIYGSPFVSSLATLVDSRKRADLDVVADRLYRAACSRPPTAEERLRFQHLARTSLSATSIKTSAPADELVFDDAVPIGATVNGSAASTWTSPDVPKPPRAGADVTVGKAEIASRRLTGLPGLSLGPRDRLTTWVYLDPTHPPTEIAVEWLTDTWKHRASWANRDSKTPGDAPNRLIGPLPETGRWVRLEVPAREVGVAGDTPVTGWSFVQAGGTAYWSSAAVRRAQESPAEALIGDALWALVANPEFQFIR